MRDERDGRSDHLRERAGLADLLRHPDRVRDLDRHAFVAVLAELHAVEGRLVDRLLDLDGQRDVIEELWTIDQTASFLHVTRDWLRRRTHLPFVVKLSDGVVRFSKTRLQAWLARRAGSRS